MAPQPAVVFGDTGDLSEQLRVRVEFIEQIPTGVEQAALVGGHQRTAVARVVLHLLDDGAVRRRVDADLKVDRVEGDLAQSQDLRPTWEDPADGGLRGGHTHESEDVFSRFVRRHRSLLAMTGL